jgi:hypothetical protein
VQWELMAGAIGAFLGCYCRGVRLPLARKRGWTLPLIVVLAS